MKPMLAGSIEDLNDIKFPVMASTKLDGVRGVILDGKLVGRSLKPIPNKFISSILSKPEYNGLDGELIIGEPDSKSLCRDTVSGCMSYEGEPDFFFFVFDIYNAGAVDAIERQKMVHERVRSLSCKYIGWLPQTVIHTIDELLAYEQRMLGFGYEGVILRSPMGFYKHGRSTLREGLLLKLKRFKDAEAVIVGFEELMHNGNEATINELGYTERSSHKENKTGWNMLGALVVTNKTTGQTFRVGTGFDDKVRSAIWCNQDQYIGKYIKYKYFEIGEKDLPRHPVFLSFRDPIDMGE